MFRSVVCVVVVLGWAGLAVAADDAKVAKGTQVYADQKCALCHSIGEKGNKKGPLDEVGSTLSAVELREWITDAPAMAAKAKAERKPAMKAFTSLAKADVDALVAYLSTLKKK